MGEARVDGRTLRRERGRAAVIDAAFELLLSGRRQLAVDDVAAAAGVSTASVFRYFDGLADLQRQAVDRFLDRFSPLLLAPDAGDGRRGERVARLVRHRLDFYERTGPILAAGRSLARRHDALAEALERSRSLRVDQVRAALGPELRDVSAARATDLVATVDALTSPEAWELLSGFHARTREQIRRAWVRTLGAAVAAWEGAA